MLQFRRFLRETRHRSDVLFEENWKVRLARSIKIYCCAHCMTRWAQKDEDGPGHVSRRFLGRMLIAGIQSDFDSRLFAFQAEKVGQVKRQCSRINKFCAIRWPHYDPSADDVRGESIDEAVNIFLIKLLQIISESFSFASFSPAWNRDSDHGRNVSRFRTSLLLSSFRQIVKWNSRCFLCTQPRAIEIAR